MSEIICKECEEYKEIREGTIHQVKAMNCRVKPSDPVFIDVATPPLLERLQREAREKLDYAWEAPPEEVIDQVIADTISQIIQELKREYEGEKKEYVYDEENEEHNDFEESLDYLETKGEAHEEGKNQGIQTCQDIGDRLLGKKE